LGVSPGRRIFAAERGKEVTDHRKQPDWRQVSVTVPACPRRFVLVQFQGVQIDAREGGQDFVAGFRLEDSSQDRASAGRVHRLQESDQGDQAGDT
jgi:hypothetical protein